MNKDQIKQLAERGRFNQEPIRGTLEETHISWVVLSKAFVFKIKKPVRLSFLDFSTLAKRKEFCEKELYLNKRFSTIYIDVVPVRYTAPDWTVGDGAGTIVDYAVQMKRLNPAKRMDKLLGKQQVFKPFIIALAKDVAHFHLSAQVIKTTIIADRETATFNDISTISRFVGDNLGIEFLKVIENSMAWSEQMLAEHQMRMAARITLGYQRDVHGDLHAGNIFVYKHPIIFDCIEFNDTFRQIDVLSEIAFLCMELEAYNRKDFAETFVVEYSKVFNCFPDPEDQVLFNYYKCLRANIRAKVHAIHCSQAENKQLFNYHLERLRIYLTLVKRYAGIK